jgi:hypothetical protein
VEQAFNLKYLDGACHCSIFLLGYVDRVAICIMRTRLYSDEHHVFLDII